MTVSVPVQVAQGLPVGEALLLRVIRGRPHKLKHRLSHVCKKSEGACVWTAAGLSPSLVCRVGLPRLAPPSQPTPGVACLLVALS